VTAPFDPSAVVLRGGRRLVRAGQLELLARYVDQGGGLLMTGGPEAFGLGGWYRTPVEAVLPVASDVRTEVTVPQVAMVIVLDISQSMAVGNPSRLELAKQGVIDVIDLAYQDDLLGLVVFSDPSLTRWVFELRPATDSGKRAMLDATLAIQPQGGTVLLPGLHDGDRRAARHRRRRQAHHRAVGRQAVRRQGPFGQPRRRRDWPDWRHRAAARATAHHHQRDRDRRRRRRRGAEALAGRRRPLLRGLRRAHAAAALHAEALTATRDLLRDEPVAPEGRRHPLSPFEGRRPPSTPTSRPA
jgi:hypothetical protein